EASRFARRTLLAGETASGRCTMPGRQRLVRVVLVDREQPPLAAAPNKNHRTAGAFVVPAGALELREAVGKGAPQVGAGRELGGIENVVEHVAQHEPACEARGGEGVVFAALGGHAENLSTLTGRRPFSSPRRAKLYELRIARQLNQLPHFGESHHMQSILKLAGLVVPAFSKAEWRWSWCCWWPPC